MLLDKLRLKFLGAVAAGYNLVGGFAVRQFPHPSGRDGMVYIGATTALFDDRDYHWCHAQHRFAFEREEARAVGVKYAVVRAIERAGLSIRRLEHDELRALLSDDYGVSDDGSQI